MTQKKKYLSSLSLQSSEIRSKTKLVLKRQINFMVRNHCFVSNITSPNKMFMTLIYLNNCQSRNTRWHRLMSGIKYQNMAFKKWLKKYITFSCFPTRFFQSVSGHSSEHVKLATAHNQLYRSYKVSPTLFQSDLRISNHRGHKFSPLLTLLSFKLELD